MTFKSPVVTLTGFGSLLTCHLGHFASLLRYLQVSFLSLGNLSYFLSALCLQVQIRCVFTIHLSQHIFNCPYLLVGLPQWVSSKESSARQEHDFNPWGNIPWRRKWQPTPVFLPGKPHGQRSLAGYSPQGHTESNTTEHAHTYMHLF